MTHLETQTSESLVYSQRPMTTPASAEAATEGLIPKRGKSAMVRGSGCEMWDASGRRYLDLTSAYGTTPLGHCHPELTAAIAEQAGRLIACSASFYNDARAAFLETLTAVLPADLGKVFLCNSGTEAIEAGRKFAFAANGKPGVVALKSDFHGRTLGALGTTWNPRFRRPFEALVHSAAFVEAGDLTALETALADDVGLFVVEVVQGESGVIEVDASYLRAAQDLCRERDVLFLVDEIQTGVGRAGSWWAHEPLGLRPDMMALAKGIAGGFPMGALASTPEVAQAMKPGMHGSTFAGFPLACSAGRTTLDVIRRDELVQRAATVGAHLREKLSSRLETTDVVKSIRGRGLMIGIELRQRVGRYLTLLMEERGVIALPAGPTVLRLLPALVIEESQLDEAVDAISSVLGEL